MTHAEIIRENKRRQGVLKIKYDPLVGTEHSPEIARRKLTIGDALLPCQYIPVEMWDEDLVVLLDKFGSIKKVAAAVGMSVKDVWTDFEKLRCKYDFEFWCATDVKIHNKDTGRSSAFVLNRPQRTILLPAMEKLRKSDEPINICLLKARQWGGSTMVQFYIIWIQRFWRVGWNSAICGHIDNQSRIVLGMYERATRHFDLRLNDGKSLNLERFMGAENTRQIRSRECTISVGSAQHPEAIRSEDLKCAHLTEVGLWQDTMKRKAADIPQSIFGSIGEGIPYTIKVLESTAKGVGNYFHIHWLRSNSVDNWNGFTPVFVAWYQIDRYSKKIDNYKTFVEEMNDYDRYLFKLGATLEAIAWYKMTLRSMAEPWRMKSEFPSTDVEAFQSTGHNYFPVEYIEEQRRYCMEKAYDICEISGDKTNGIEALDNIEIRKESNGRLKVWEYPDVSVKMSDRYLVVVDLGVGRSDGADNSVICVFDRYWQHEPEGMPEVVAEWSGHLDMDLLAWKAAQIATAYDNALLVVESNSAENNREDHFRTILKEVGEHYPNFYRRAKRDQDKGGIDRYGFHTNGSTKYTVCDYLLKALRQGMYIERNEEALNEMRVFERKSDGKLGAVDGNHDDRVMTRAIGCYFMFAEGKMPVPQFVDEAKAKQFTVTTDFV